MNHRQLSLHSIIKTQQSKICQLREELSIVSQLSETRVNQNERHREEELQQKNSLIEYLKQELERERNKNQDSNKLVLESSRYALQKGSLSEENSRLKQLLQQQASRIKLLEQKNSEYDAIVRKLRSQKSKLKEETEGLTINKSHVSLEIDKLSKFYKSAIFDIPKRKETLLWVDKLLGFMEEHALFTQKEEDKHTKMVESFKEYINGLKAQIQKSISEAALTEEKLKTETESISRSMRQILEQKKEQEESLFEKFEKLLKLNKKQKEEKQLNETEVYKRKVEQLAKTSNEQIESLHKRNKQLESQKKSLLLGFQQTKSFLESREATFKEEIRHLKETISDLMAAAEAREEEFEDEIKMLSSQIESISERYYENIEYPFMKINQTVEVQIRRVKQELMRINQSGNAVFGKALEKIGENMVKFVKDLETKVCENEELKLCLSRNEQNLNNLAGLIVQGQLGMKSHGSLNHSTQVFYKGFSSRQPRQLNFSPLFGNSRYNHQSQEGEGKNTRRMFQKQAQELAEMKTAVQEIEEKERENKYRYEISLLKKHNEKLNNLLNTIEQRHQEAAEKSLRCSSKYHRNGNSRPTEVTPNQIKNQRRVIELQSEIQSLKEAKSDYEQILREELQKVADKIQDLKQSIREGSQSQRLVIAELRKIQENQFSLMETIERKHSQTSQLLRNVGIINNMLIRPAETFESLVKEVTEFASSSSSQQVVRSFASDRTSWKRYQSQEEKMDSRAKEYVQIIERRNESGKEINRFVSELIKTVRNTYSSNSAKRNQQNQLRPSLKEEAHHNGANSNLHANTNKAGPCVEKRMRELQQQVLRYRNELNSRIEKVVDQLSSIAATRDKKSRQGKFADKKLEQGVDQRLNQFVVQIGQSASRDQEKFASIKVNAIKDLECKLKESLRENEGLMKELNAIQAIVHGLSSQSH